MTKRILRLTRVVSSLALAALIVVAGAGGGWAQSDNDCDKPCCQQPKPPESCCASESADVTAPLKGCPCELRSAAPAPEAEAVLTVQKMPLALALPTVDFTPRLLQVLEPTICPCPIVPRIRAPDASGHPLRAPPSL